jgi:mutator protein MutT
MNTFPELHVAAGVVINNDKQFLIGRKKIGSSNAGFWEFPGGKIESTETPSQALLRELQEELGIQVEILKEIGLFTTFLPDKMLVLHGFLCLTTDPIVQSSDHDLLCWCALSESSKYLFTQADLPILSALAFENALI